MTLVWVVLAFLVGWLVGAMTALGFQRRHAPPVSVASSAYMAVRWPRA